MPKYCCARSQRGKCCVDIKSGVASERENRPFTQIASRIRNRVYRVRANQTCAIAALTQAESQRCCEKRKSVSKLISANRPFHHFYRDTTQPKFYGHLRKRCDHTAVKVCSCFAQSRRGTNHHKPHPDNLCVAAVWLRRANTCRNFAGCQTMQQA